MTIDNYYTNYQSVPTQKVKTLRCLGQSKITLFASYDLAGPGHLPGEFVLPSGGS